MKNENKYITYEGYKHDRYIGKRLYEVIECDSDKYRIKESMLVKDKDGNLGSIGYGIHWGMNYLTQSGGYAFNPIKESDLIWSEAHNCYLYKKDKAHFLYPIIQSEFYIFKKGVKYTYVDEKVAKLPKRYAIFKAKSEHY